MGMDPATWAAIGFGVTALSAGYDVYSGKQAKKEAGKTPQLPNEPKPAETGDMAGQMLAAQKMAQSAGGTILSKDQGLFGSDTINPRKSLLGL